MSASNLSRMLSKSLTVESPVWWPPSPSSCPISAGSFSSRKFKSLLDNSRSCSLLFTVYIIEPNGAKFCGLRCCRAGKGGAGGWGWLASGRACAGQPSPLLLLLLGPKSKVGAYDCLQGFAASLVVVAAHLCFEARAICHRQQLSFSFSFVFCALSPRRLARFLCSFFVQIQIRAQFCLQVRISLKGPSSLFAYGALLCCLLKVSAWLAILNATRMHNNALPIALASLGSCLFG